MRLKLPLRSCLLCASVSLWFISFAFAGRAHAQAAAVDESFFEAKIRPVLVEHCFKCHGPEKTSGGLRLDSRASLLRGGQSGAVVVAGRPEKSLLLQALRHDDNAELKMPDRKSTRLNSS